MSKLHHVGPHTHADKTTAGFQSSSDIRRLVQGESWIFLCSYCHTKEDLPCPLAYSTRGFNHIYVAPKMRSCPRFKRTHFLFPAFPYSYSHFCLSFPTSPQKHFDDEFCLIHTCAPPNTCPLCFLLGSLSSNKTDVFLALFSWFLLLSTHLVN